MGDHGRLLGMTIYNADISALINLMASLLEIEGSNPFRIRANGRLAATVDDLAESVTGMIAEDRPLSNGSGCLNTSPNRAK